jgi:hypothetical protein
MLPIDRPVAESKWHIGLKSINLPGLPNGLCSPRVLLTGKIVEVWMAEGRTKYPKMFAIRAGDILITFAGFTCIRAGVLVRIECDAAGLYFRCADGNHYLESQRDENDECLGLCHAPLA